QRRDDVGRLRVLRTIERKHLQLPCVVFPPSPDYPHTQIGIRALSASHPLTLTDRLRRQTSTLRVEQLNERIDEGRLARAVRASDDDEPARWRQIDLTDALVVGDRECLAHACSPPATSASAA